jgi:hypothetical protein
MSRTPKQYIVCDSLEHAQLVDYAIFTFLNDRDGTQGTCWSGVWVKPGTLSDTYGVLWGAPGSDLFGTPEEEALLTIDTEVIDEDGNSNWVPLPEPEQAQGGEL